MKVINKKITLVLLICIIIISLSGCAKSGTTSETTGLMNVSWEDILEESKGQTVNFHLWGGSSGTNKYLDEWVAPKLKEQYDITLNTVPVNEVRDMINKVQTEKDVKKEKGSIDMWWINGENFKLAKDNELLWDSFADKLPNYQEYIDNEALDNIYDFGVATEGLEVPWGKSQFVMIYDSAKIDEPPKSIEELKDWIKENPNKFTYPSSNDFTGSAFIRHVLFSNTDRYGEYLNEGMEKTLEEDLIGVWEYLNDIKPYIWRNGENYPESSGKMDQLFSNGEIWMTMSYNPVHALNKIRMGEFPETTRTFMFDEGTISNTHYLSMPYNGQNKAATMAVINFLISPEAQIAKFKPEYWGDGIAISIDKMPEEDKAELNKIDLGESVLPLDMLAKGRIPEVLANYVIMIEEGWFENVAK